MLRLRPSRLLNGAKFSPASLCAAAARMLRAKALSLAKIALREAIKIWK